MQPVADVLAAPEAPSLAGAAIRMVLALAVVIAAAWVFLKWRQKASAPRRELEVLDRAFLARGASVALLRVGTRRLLVGVSGDGVRLVSKLDSGESFVAALGEAEARRGAAE